MNARFLTCLCVVCCAVALPAASRYWVAYNGSNEGVWSDTHHWKDGAIATSADNVYINISGKITLDGSYSVRVFTVYSGNNTIVLGGDGSLTEVATVYEHIYAGMTLEIADAAYYNASKPPQYESHGTLRLSGGGMRTDKYVPGPLTDICGGALTNSSATFTSGCACTVSAGELRATGAITFSSGSSLSATGGRVSAASGVTFASGSTLTVASGELELGKATFNAGAKIVLGANATLRLAHTSSIKTADITADPTAKIVFSVPDGTTAARSTPIVLPRGGADLEELGVTVEIDAPEGWSGCMIGPCYFITGGVATTPTYTYEWTGAEDGYWSNGNNWKDGVAPTTAGVNVYISGEKNMVMTNDIEGASFNCLHILSGTAPVVIRGQPIKLTTDTTGWSGNVALRSYSDNPVIFEVKVTFTNRYGYSDARSGYISHRGGIAHTSSNSSRFVQYSGAILYGGTASFRRMQARTTSGCTLTYLPDADYTFTEQTEALTKGGALTVMEGANLTVNSLCQVNNLASVIDGTLYFKGTLTGSQKMVGTGLLKTSGTFSTATEGAYSVAIGGSLTLLPASWNTQPAENVTYSICATNGTPRLAAAGDWTYGPAEGEASADRALHIAAAASLTVDTQDPETDEGHTITFVDPINAEGSLVKDGAGTLVLPAGDISIGGSFTMSNGTVKVSGCLDVAGAFVAEEGASFAFANGFDVGNGVTLVSAASIEGVPAVPAGYRARIREDAESGKAQLRVSKIRGFVFTLH